MTAEIYFPHFCDMKRISLVLSFMALGFSMAHAGQVYTITLKSSEKFTECAVVYKSSETTKFQGKDGSGQAVTKEVPTQDIVMMREEVKGGEPSAQKGEAASSPDTQAKAGDQQAETIADGNVAQRVGEDKAEDATLRLRQRLAQLDTEMAKISKPSRSLQSQVSQAKRRVTSQLKDMDESSLEVARLQDEFNKAGAADFTFDEVTPDQRDQYVRDGEAAHRAMKIDMKERKGRRKVAGLDKFEIMRERYQGIPEYKEAYEWYVRTLYALQKKWNSMQKREDAARKRLNTERRELRNRQDEAEYREIAAKLQEEGDDISKVWFVPPARNLKMLNLGVVKVKDAIRRNEDRPLDEEVGTVPSLLQQYWEQMDKVRMAMINGDLEGAENLLRDNGAYPLIMRLKTHLLPNEYRTPLVNQHREVEKEIRRRMRDYNNLKGKLERATRKLDSVTRNAEAQLDSAMNAIQKELDTDVGENTMEVEQAKPAAAAPAPKQKP